MALNLFHDEGGDWSMARVLVAVWTLVALGAVVHELFYVDAAGEHYQLSNPAWAAMSAIEIALIAWAAGPRVAEYLGPQISAVAHSVAQAIRSPRLPSRQDSERDEPAKPTKKG